MDAEDKRSAEAVLRHLFVGRYVCGVHFYGQPVLVIDALDRQAAPLKDEVSLHIETRWRLYDAAPAVLPACAEELEPLPLPELCRVAGELRPQRICGATLGEAVPHLLLHFADGRVLFVNGHHERYETWQVYAEDFLLVAFAVDKIAVGVPPSFAVA